MRCKGNQQRQYFSNVQGSEYNETSHYDYKENALYQFVLSVNGVHCDSLNKRVVRGEMAKLNSQSLASIIKWIPTRLSYQTS